MGEGIICKKGGVQMQTVESTHALICAKFPARSSCVCSRGSESFTAEGGMGLAAFAVTENGTWTVTISDGTRSRSGSVSINAAGEIKTIQINYPSDPVVSESGVLLSAENGLASGYSLGGNARMNGNAIRGADIKGGSARLELGATMKPDKAPWSLDLNVTGFAGKKQGVMGGVSFAWLF